MTTLVKGTLAYKLAKMQEMNGLLMPVGSGSVKPTFKPERERKPVQSTTETTTAAAI